MLDFYKSRSQVELDQIFYPFKLHLIDLLCELAINRLRRCTKPSFLALDLLYQISQKLRLVGKDLGASLFPPYRSF
jgi:hypothetical protein